MKNLKEGDKIIAICIENVGCLTLNKVYEFIRFTPREGNNMVEIKNDKGRISDYMISRFIKVVQPSSEEIIEKYKKARELIGKKIYPLIHSNPYPNMVYTVKDVVLKFSNPIQTSSIKKNFGLEKYVIEIHCKEQSYYSYNDIAEYIPEIKLKLNDQYSAKLYKDKVVVGCQTFSTETIKMLYNKLMELQ